MKIELGLTGLYHRYLDIREDLPLFYCKKPFQYRTVEGGVHLYKTVEKGLYRCEDTNNGKIKIYDTYVGVSLWKDTFDECFKKPSKLKLFLHKHFS